MAKSPRIYVAGHRGMVVSGIVGQVANVENAKVITQTKLGWTPEITLDETVTEMVASDLEAAKRQVLLMTHEYNVTVAAE